MKTLPSVLGTFFVAVSLTFAQGGKTESLVGNWLGHEEGDSGDDVALEFKADGSGSLNIEGEAVPMTYKENRSVKPHQLDLTLKLPGMPEAQTMLTIFEVVDADTIKIAEPAEVRPVDFSEGDNLIAERRGAENVGVAKRLIGKWSGEEPDNGDEILLEFAEDGTGSVGEKGNTDPFTYTVEGTEAPYKLTLDMDGELASTIFEFQGKDAVKIDEPDESAGEEFSDSAIVFHRAGAAAPAPAPVAFKGKPAKAIVGSWEMTEPDDGVALTFNADGTGTLSEGNDDEAMKYALDTSVVPNEVAITIDGETKYSLFEFVTKNSFLITEPEDEVPSDLKRAATFERIKK